MVAPEWKKKIQAFFLLLLLVVALLGQWHSDFHSRSS